MKKMIAVLASLCLVLAGISPVLAADEDYSDTDAWYEKCTKVQTSSEGVKACEGFQAYQKEKKQALSQSIESFNASISSLSMETEAMEAKIQEQRTIQASLEAEIAQTVHYIQWIDEQILNVQMQIAQKQEEINVWDEQIKERMRSEQASVGTNALVDLLMGSSSLADLLRRITGLERITQSDQSQIQQLEVMKQDLENTRQEFQNLADAQKEQQAALEEQQAQAAALEASYQAMVEQYQGQIAELEAQKRNAEIDLDSIREFSITASLSAAIDYSSIGSVAGFINPVPGSQATAGTWYYAGGGLHLGADKAAPVGTPLLAPADGLIIMVNKSAPSTGGYLGNWAGFPFGSGNSIEMLCQVGGTLYAILFCHLSSDLYVSPGQSVVQGQVLGLTGNSGNSSGPHTHIEVFNLGSMSMSDAVNEYMTTGDLSFKTQWGTTATACDYKGSAPCRERPEKFF